MDKGSLLKELRIDRVDSAHASRRLPRGRWWVVVPALIVFMILAGAWSLPHRHAPRVTTVKVSAPVSAAAADDVLQATGYITARREATVSAQIVGTLTEVPIEEGDHVKKGQVLARLEDSAQSARLHAAYENAQAARAQTLQTQAELMQARHDMRRLDVLVKKGLVARQLAEQARTKVRILKAQRNAQRKRAKAASAKAHVAEVNYDYTIVRAPFAGVVTRKTAQVGEIIAPAAAGGGFTRTGVCTIVDMHSLEVDVDVNESYIGRVKPGMSARAVLDAYPEWMIPAHVIAIVPTADRGKATVKVRVALHSRDERIIPDMGVRVSFLGDASAESDHAARGVMVPASALVRRGRHVVVFTLKNGHASAHVVGTPQETGGGMRLLFRGVSPGATVIDKPPRSLRDGDKVVSGSEHT